MTMWWILEYKTTNKNSPSIRIFRFVAAKALMKLFLHSLRKALTSFASAKANILIPKKEAAVSEETLNAYIERSTASLKRLF